MSPKTIKDQKKVPYGKIAGFVALGQLIRAKRVSSGFTLHQAAGLIGVGPRFLSEVERGKRSAEMGKVLQVLDRMGIVLWAFPRGEVPRLWNQG